MRYNFILAGLLIALLVGTVSGCSSNILADRNIKTRYSLMIAKENARKFPIIVNNANEKPEEFIFDPIDFQSLLSGAESSIFFP